MEVLYERCCGLGLHYLEASLPVGLLPAAQGAARNPAVAARRNMQPVQEFPALAALLGSVEAGLSCGLMTP